MPSLIIKNANVFDGESADLLEGQQLYIEDDRIREVSGTPARQSSADTLDVNGAYVMPGLIDAHVHVTDWGTSPAELVDTPASYTALRAARNLRAMLHRGFTTVRDACGADFGLAMAIDQGLIESPRLFFVGRALSATGGHGDFRTRGNDRSVDVCGCADRGLSLVVDGEPAVRQAARNELRKGAHAIKIMASGGVASPTDPIDNLQFSEAEIRAVVEEASFWRAYVMAHAYTADAIRRCLEFGVRSIEHANLIDLDTAKLATDKGAYVVPTLITYTAMHERGREIGLAEHSLRKLEDVRSAGLKCLEYLQQAGTKTGFGTDLFGELQTEQLRELVIRAQVDKAVDVLRSATSINASLLGMGGKLGCVKPDAYADLLVVQKNPLEDLSVLLEGSGQVSHIMQAGRFIRRP